jgi:hypothetical protein
MNFFDYFIKHYVQLNYGVTYVITEIVSCMALSLIFNHIKPKDYKSWLRFGVDFVCTLIVYLLLSSAFYCLIPQDASMSGYLRFMTWPLLSVIHAFYPREMGRRSRVTCVFGITVFIELAISFSGTLGSMISAIAGKPDSLWTDWTMYFVLSVLLVIVVLFGVLSPFKYKYVRLLPTVLMNVVFGLTFILMILANALLNVDYEEVGINVFLSTTYLILLAINFIVYTIFYFNVRAYNQILDFQAMSMKAESENHQLEISNAKYEELHKLRHDLKNQMGLLSGFVRDHKYEELEDYLADINEKTYVAIDYFETGNTFVSAILNMELSKAKSHGLRIEGKISIPSELNISANDLSSLLCNLLDNSIEANLRYGIKDKIEVSMLYEAPYLFITVRNHIPKDVDEKKLLSLNSSKGDRMNHGYGTKVIRDISSKYNGTTKFEVQDGCFVFDGMLLLKDGKEE